jgi:hypothetical protein
MMGDNWQNLEGSVLQSQFIHCECHVCSYPELNSKFCHKRPVLSNYLHINEIWSCHTLFQNIHVCLGMTLHCWVCGSCHFEGIRCYKCAGNHSPTNTALCQKTWILTVCGDCSDCSVLNFDTMCWSLMLVFWMNVLLPSSGLKVLGPRWWWSDENCTSNDVKTHVIN